MPTEKDILKFLAGDLSKKDQKQLDAEKQSNPALSEDLDLMSMIWQQADHIKSFESFDTNAAWDKFSSVLGDSEESPAAKVVDLREKASDTQAPLRRRLLGYLGVAASIAILVMAGLFLLNKDPFITVGGDTWAYQTTLEDGTEVFLNDSNSVLIYPRTFQDKDERRVVIKGNSRLDVTSDETKPFFVDNYKAGIEVVGTEFIIESDSSASTLENVTGVMSFFDIKNREKSKLLDSTGQKFTYNGTEFIDENPPPVPVVIDTPGVDLKIIFIFDELSGIFPEFLITSSATDVETDGNEIVRVDMNQSLDGIIAQLDSTAAISYRQLGNVYYLSFLKKKR